MRHSLSGRHLRHTILCALLALCAFGAKAFSQVSTANVTGTITDPSGALIPGAQMVLKSTATGIEHASVSNSDGTYSFDFMPIGGYSLEATAAGFQGQLKTNITLNTADTARVDFQLALSSNSTIVQVSTETVTLDTTSPQQVFDLSATAITQLPVSRQDWTSVLQLGAGVTTNGNGPSPAGASLSINGLPPAGFNLTVDGTNATSDPETPAFGFYQGPNIINTINNDAIEEVSIVKGIAPATVGGTMSGNVNIVTKSGTNRYHGSLYEINETSVLDARNQFLTSKPRLTFNEFGGSIGGPIVSKKLFGFGSYEGARVSAFQAVSATVPTPYLKSIAPLYANVLNAYPAIAQPAGDPTAISTQYFGVGALKQSDGNGAVRIDYNLNENNLIYVRYIRARPFKINPDAISVNARTTTGHADAINAGFTHSEHNWTSLTRFGSNRIRLQRLDGGFASDLEELVVGGIDSEGSEQFVKSGHFYSFEQEFAKTLGKHSLTSGFILQWQDAGRTDFNTATLKYGSTTDFVNNLPNQVVITFDLNPFNLRSYQYGGFLQDDYKITPDLTLNLGLRYDYFTIPKENSGRVFNRGVDPANPQLGPGFGPYLSADSMYNADYNNYQPRVGFTLSPGRSKDTVIRAGAGVFVSPHPIFGGPIEEVQDSASTPFRVTLTGAQATNSGLQYPLPRSGYQDDLTSLQDRGIISTQVVNTAINSNFPNPYSLQWMLGVEQTLPFSHRIEIDYVGNRASKLNMTETKNLPDRTSGVLPVPNFPQFRYYYAGDASNYNGLQVQLIKSPWHGLNYGFSYAWSRNMSFADANLLLQTNPQDNDNIKADYGRTPFDVRQRFHANFLWIPEITDLTGMHSRPSKLLMDGWQVAGIVSAESGAPVVIRNGNSSYPSDRPDVVNGISPYLQGSRSTRLYLNAAAFTAVPISPLSLAQVRGGDLHRNEISNPGSVTLDATLGKTFDITESVKFQLKASAFNALNHTNYSGLQGNVSSSQFGELTSATPRTMQLTGRFTF
jgi:outer membrane receptor protein involved in Fe transport